MMFSTSTGADADVTSDDSGAPAVAGVDKGEEGSGNEEGAEEGAGEGEAAAPVEENPLEGMAADDGDPGPPPPLDPSIVTEPSPKVKFFSVVVGGLVVQKVLHAGGFCGKFSLSLSW